MGKWVQKGGYRKKNVQNGNTHFILLEICAWLSEKNSKAPFRGLPASIRYFRII